MPMASVRCGGVVSTCRSLAASSAASTQDLDGEWVTTATPCGAGAGAAAAYAAAGADRATTAAASTIARAARESMRVFMVDLQVGTSGTGAAVRESLGLAGLVALTGLDVLALRS